VTADKQLRARRIAEQIRASRAKRVKTETKVTQGDSLSKK
jgi:hypothetical protein